MEINKTKKTGVIHMSALRTLILFMCLTCSILTAGEITLCSYNCGGLSDHYDYLRAAAMQKLMQERFDAEPEQMALNDKIQQLALKLLFAPGEDQMMAREEWEQKGYQSIIESLTAAPTKKGSPNARWYQKSMKTISSYHVRPVKIDDKEVHQMIQDHIKDLTRGKKAGEQERLEAARAKMAQRIFHYHLKYDIICLQEADYLEAGFFPEQYEVLFSKTDHSLNGIAWKKDRFDLIDTIGDIMGRAFAVQLEDKKSGKTILVASGHLTGCNPYRVEKDPSTGKADSSKGDGELQAIIALFDKYNSDLKIVGIDSNVTSLHPRLAILKEAGFRIDAENHLEATCTNPYQMLNTRIDWIAVKPGPKISASIVNIPVLGVGLNSIQSNMSDHKPIAAKIEF